MTESIGSTEVPLAVPATGESVTDPLISTLLSYFKATVNAHGTDAWRAVEPGRDPKRNVPIAFTFAHDPHKSMFAENRLPALFMYRAGQGTREDIAADIQLLSGKITMIWVPPSITDESRRAIREPFCAGIFRAMNVYFEHGRDPAWYVEGDGYPPRADLTDEQNIANTKALGSVLGHYVKFWRAWIEDWAPYILPIPVEGAKPRLYEAYKATFVIQEDEEPDIERFDLLGGVDMRLNVPADATNPEYVLDEEIFD